MTNPRYVASTMGVILLFGAASAAFGQPSKEPAAVNAAQQMRAYLHDLKSFEVRGDGTMDDVLDDGLKVQLSNRVRYEYRAPDKLFAEWQSDRQLRRLYYDGRHVTLVSPIVGYYASTDMTGSVADMLQRLSERYGIVFPLPDLFLWAWSSEPVQGVTTAMDVGYARIAQVDTEQLLFRSGDVDWQVWVERGAQPLPRKMVITDRSDPERPAYSAMLQWNPNVQLPDDHFVFTPPADARRIELTSLDAKEAQ